MDPCGRCDGQGIAIDSLGFCCESNSTHPGKLDAQGICCRGFVDECGVCNGNNACDLKADFVLRVGPASTFLVAMTNLGRRLRAVVQDDVAEGMTAITGRVFDKSCILTTLSAYIPPKPKPAADSTISASEGWDGQLGSGPGGQAVAAVPRMRPDSQAGSLPVQMDDIRQAPEQLDAPATHANLAAQRPASASAFEALSRQAGLIGIRGSTAAQQQDGPVSTTLDSDRFATSSIDGPGAVPQGVVRHLLAWQARQTLQQANSSSPSSSSLAQPVAQPAVGAADDALVINIILKVPSSGSGAELGSVLMTLNSLVGKEQPIPGMKKSFKYVLLSTLGRAGTCGDGVCQVSCADRRRPSPGPGMIAVEVCSQVASICYTA